METRGKMRWTVKVQDEEIEDSVADSSGKSDSQLLAKRRARSSEENGNGGANTGAAPLGGTVNKRGSSGEIEPFYRSEINQEGSRASTGMEGLDATLRG